jgi:hypothetical protein
VLVTFVQPSNNKQEAFTRRHPTSGDALTIGMMRRCVPASQLEAAIRVAHAGPVKSGHLGQDNTQINANRHFDGIQRKLVRQFCRRCPICLTKQQKKFREPITTLVSKQLWERVVMDLVDFGEARRSPGMRYM